VRRSAGGKLDWRSGWTEEVVEPLRRLEEGFMVGDCWWEREREGRFLGMELDTGNVGGEVARWWKGGGEDIAEGYEVAVREGRGWQVPLDALT